MSLYGALRIRRTDKRSLASVALAMRRAYPFGQFGQANDTRTANGATGCTDTVMQFIALLVKGVWYTHDQIRARVGHRDPLTGLRYGEVGAWFLSVGLPYRVELGLSADAILSLVRTRGPVLVGEMYGQHPSWQGFRYGGRVASPKPNGYAWPLAKAGRTQLGPTFRHAIGVLAVGPIAAWKGALGVYILEPNHGSPARPEQVPYDVITVPQFRQLMTGYAAANGKTYAAYPTRAL